MPLTRRELCSVLPIALLPALLSREDPPTPQNSLPSAAYPFENLPVQTVNNAQFRNVLKGQARHRGIAGSARNHLAAGRRTASPTSSCALGNVADSRRNGGTCRERQVLSVGPRLGRLRIFQRRARHQKCWRHARHLFRRCHRPRSSFLTQDEKNSFAYPKQNSLSQRKHLSPLQSPDTTVPPSHPSQSLSPGRHNFTPLYSAPALIQNQSHGEASIFVARDTALSGLVPRRFGLSSGTVTPGCALGLSSPETENEQLATKNSSAAAPGSIFYLGLGFSRPRLRTSAHSAPLRCLSYLLFPKL